MHILEDIAKGKGIELRVELGRVSDTNGYLRGQLAAEKAVVQDRKAALSRLRWKMAGSNSTMTVHQMPPTLSLHPGFEDAVIEVLAKAVREQIRARFCLRPMTAILGRGSLACDVGGGWRGNGCQSLVAPARTQFKKLPSSLQRISNSWNP